MVREAEVGEGMQSALPAFSLHSHTTTQPSACQTVASKAAQSTRRTVAPPQRDCKKAWRNNVDTRKNAHFDCHIKSICTLEHASNKPVIRQLQLSWD